MRRLLFAMMLILAGCAETVRCPDGQVFGDDGRCEPIDDRDGGPGNGDGG